MLGEEVTCTPTDGRELYDFVTGSTERRNFREALDVCSRVAKSEAKSIITDAMNLISDGRGNMLLHRLAAAVPYEDANDKTQKPLLRELLQFFLKRRAPVAARNCRGQTALHVAAAAGNEVACEVLLKFKSDIVARDARLKLPEQLAEHGNHKALADSLKQHRHVLGVDGAIDEAFSGLSTGPTGEAESELERIVGLKTAELHKSLADARVLEERAKQEARKAAKRRDELIAEADQLRAQRQTLDTENNRLSQQLEEAEKQSKKHEDLIKNYKARLEMILGPTTSSRGYTKTEVQAYLDQLEAKDAELRDLRSKVASQESVKSQEESRNIEVQASSLAADQAELREAAAAALQAERDELALLVSVQNSNLSDALQKLTEAQQELQDLRTQLDAVRTQHEEQTQSESKKNREALVSLEAAIKESKQLLSAADLSRGELEERQRATEDENRLLKQQLTSSTQLVGELRACIADTEKTNSSDKSAFRVSELTALLEKTREDLAAQTSFAQTSVREGAAALAEVRSLCGMLDGAKLELHVAQKQLSEQASLIAALSTAADVKAEKAPADAGVAVQFNELRVEFATCKAKLEATERELERTDARVARAERDKDVADERLSRAEKSLEEAKHRLLSMERERSETAIQLAAAEQQVLGLKATITRLEQSAGTVPVLSEQLTQSKNRCDELERVRARLQSDLGAMEQTLKAAQDDKRDLQKSLRAAEDSMAAARRQVAEMQQQRDEIRRSLEESRNVTQELATEKAVLEGDRERLLVHITTPRRDSGAGDAKCSELESQLLQARADIEYLQRSLKNSVETIHHKEISIEALERQLLLMPKDMTDLHDQLEGARRERDEASAALALLSKEKATELKKCNNDDDVRAELEALAHAGEVENLRSQLKNAKEEGDVLRKSEEKNLRELKLMRDRYAQQREQLVLFANERDSAVSRLEAVQRQLTVLMQQVLDRDAQLEKAREYESTLHKELEQLQSKRSCDTQASLAPLQLQLLVALENADRSSATGKEAAERMALHHQVAVAALRSLILRERRAYTGTETSVKSQMGRTVLELRQQHAEDHIPEDTTDATEEPQISPAPPPSIMDPKGFNRGSGQAPAAVIAATAPRSRSAESESEIIVDIPANANFDLVKIGGLCFSTSQSPSIFYKQQCLLHQVRPSDHVLRQLHNNPDGRKSIQTVDVAGCSLTRGAARAIIDLLFVCNGLEKLDLSRNFLADNVTEYIRLVVVATQAHYGKTVIALTHLLFDGNLVASTNSLAELCDMVPTLSVVSVASSALLSQSSQAALQAKLDARRYGASSAGSSTDPLLPIRPIIRSRPSSASRTPYTLRPVL
jgi:hypothetical protein